MIHARLDYNGRIVDSANIIPSDEPVFLIRGQDALAENIIMKYAKLLERAGGSNVMVKQIRDHAEKVRNWKVKKIADLPDDVIDQNVKDKPIDGLVNEGESDDASSSEEDEETETKGTTSSSSNVVPLQTKQSFTGKFKKFFNK